MKETYMKKKLKIFFSIVGIIVLAVGGYLLYIFNFKTYDVADDEVEQIVADPYEIELPDGSKLVLDEDGGVAEQTPVSREASSPDDGEDADSTEDAPDLESEPGTSQTKGSPTTPNAPESGQRQPDAAQKPTVASIKQKYAGTFQALQGQADSKLNALVGRAKSEYSTKKDNGESIDFGYFYNKYTGAASGLEAQTDAVFNGVLIAVEQDLMANGFDKAYAQSFKDEYEAKKKARRDSLIGKAMGQ